MVKPISQASACQAVQTDWLFSIQIEDMGMVEEGDGTTEKLRDS